MEVQLIKISSLKLLENNPRTITKEQMQKLCKSIQDDPEFLKCRPVLVNKTCVWPELSKHDEDGETLRRIDTLTVYAGNQRVRAAKKLKMKEIPCIIEENLCDEIMKKRTILDNKTFGNFDFDILLNEFDTEMLLDCGFTMPELTGEDINISGEDLQDDEEEVEPPKEPKTKPGDLYELGVHRLKCGDSTNSDDVTDVLSGATPILMVTDPPYGVNYDASWRKISDGNKGRKVKSFGKVVNDSIKSWKSAFKLFNGEVAYIWHSSLQAEDTLLDIKSIGFILIYQIIWVKQLGFSMGDYHHYHEPCYVAVKKGCRHNWQGSRKERTVWEIQSRAALGNTSQMEEATGHSTQKPLECMAKPIRNNTAEGEGVYDPFLGSGTTLIAAEKLNRICYGLEIDPAYCDIIVQRWCKLTGKKAKRNGVEIDEL